MKPIPKQLLIHEAMLHKEINKDRWGNGDTDSGTILSDIRIEPSTKIVRDKNNVEIQLAAMLFYDCKNSRPKGISFEVDDIIVFNGQKHQVRIVEPLYDNKRLHHYELGLIKHA